jgi:hypothetical protein
MEYTVTWVIEIEAESHEAAARQALAIQRDPESTATVFKVESEDDKDIPDKCVIDVEDL